VNPTARILPGERPNPGSHGKKDGETGTSSRPVRNAASLYSNGTGGPGCAARSAARPAALPCPKSNNSTDRATDAAVHRLTGGHMRTAFALEENVKLLAANFGINRLGLALEPIDGLVWWLMLGRDRVNVLPIHPTELTPATVTRPAGQAARQP